MLCLNSVSKSFGIRKVVQNLSLKVSEGEVLVILGPSGCGKTTLLRLIAGLEDADSGSITLFGDDLRSLPVRSRGVAMVFQAPALNPHLSCRENIEYPLVIQGIHKTVRRDKVTAQATKLGLTKEILDQSPVRVSGGEAQRVSLARALVREPRCFLLDEPLSALDPHMRITARREIRDIHRGLAGSTKAMMVFVTHDQDDAITVADRIAVMREGQLEQVGTPQEVFDSPRTLFVGQFFGRPPMNVVLSDVTLDGKRVRVGRLLASDRTRPVCELSAVEVPPDGTRFHVGIRPNNLVGWTSAAPSGPVISLGSGRIIDTEGVGDSVFAYCETDLGHLYVKTIERTRGLDLNLGVAADCLHWFDEVTGVRC